MQTLSFSIDADNNVFVIDSEGDFELVGSLQDAISMANDVYEANGGMLLLSDGTHSNFFISAYVLNKFGDTDKSTQPLETETYKDYLLRQANNGCELAKFECCDKGYIDEKYRWT